MTLAVSIIGHVERCPQNDSDDGLELAFTFNLSVGLTGKAGPADELRAFVDDYLRPWRWALGGPETGPGLREARLQVAVIQGNTATRREVVARAPAMAPAASQTWRSELERRLGRIRDEAQLVSFTWPPSTADGGMYEYDGDEPSSLDPSSARTQRRWFAELLDMSREPAPLPHDARLTWFFRIAVAELPADLEGVTIIAAPIFAFREEGPKRVPWWPQPPAEVEPPGVPEPPESIEFVECRRTDDGTWRRRTLCRDDVNGCMRWSYEAGEPEVTAYVNAAPVAVAPMWGPGGQWERGWVDLTNALYGDDWLGELEWRAADHFDLPALLLRYLEKLAPAAQDDAAKELEPLFVASLRDLVQTGASCRVRVTPGAPARPTRPGSPTDPVPPTLVNDYGFAADVLRELAMLEKQYDGRVVDEGFASDAAEILTALERWETAGVTASTSLDEWWRSALEAAALPVPVGAQKAAFFERLRTLHGALLSDERARELVFGQWDAVLRATPNAERLWPATRRDSVRAQVLPSLLVRKRQAMSHMGVVWVTMMTELGPVSSNGDRTSTGVAARLEAALSNALVTYLRTRAEPGVGDPMLFADLPRPVASVSEDLLTRIETWIRAEYAPSAIERILDGAKNREELEPGMHPDAVVFNLAEVAGEDPHTAGEASDPLRGVAGFGLLLKVDEADAPAPTCLTIADIRLRADESTALNDCRVVPVRMSYRNGMRRALVSYNNEPITARSPAGQLAANHPFQGDEDRDKDFDDDPFTYRNPFTPTNKLRLPGLRFGRSYGAAAFVVGVGGTLPSSVGDPTDFTALAAPAAWKPFHDWERFTYRRRVAVGQLRAEARQGPRVDNETAFDNLPLPPIPPTVHPIAGSLRAIAPPDQEPEDTVSALRQSLVLLVPPNDSRWRTDVGKTDFPFFLRPPSVDLQVWDRSFGFGSTDPTALLKRSRTQRIAVWSESFAVTRDNEQARDGTDMSLDDPTVTGVFASLRRLHPAPDTDPIRRIYPFSLASGTDGVHGEQAAPLPCVIKSAASGRATLDPQMITATIPKGEVWELELSPIVDGGLEGTFQQKLWTETLQERDGLPNGRVGGSRRFVVEVADNPMPSAKSLHAALRSRVVAGAVVGPAREPWGDERVATGLRSAGETLRSPWRVEVGIDPSRVSDDAERNAFVSLHRVALLTQRWRWNGRSLADISELPTAGRVRVATTSVADTPLTPSQFFAAWKNGQDEQLDAWDGRLFGDRDRDDYRMNDGVVDFGDEGGTLAGTHRVFHEDVTQDAGALYFRFAIQAFSRYDGLLTPNAAAPVDSRRGRDGIGEAWHRLVVPCRRSEALGPPRVKLVLPLTDVRVPGDETTEATPGLLVVLNEPWFRYGGMAEELAADLALASEPDFDDATQPRRRAELGPDPITQAADSEPPLPPIVPTDEAFPGALGVLPVRVLGPIGFTFDTDTLAPEFVHTAFIIPAPELAAVAIPAEGADTPDDVRDLSWYFLKLRFRRRIVAAGLLVSDTDLESEATGPVWTQFLPPTSLFLEEGADGPRVAVTSLALVHTSTAQWQFVRKRESPLDTAKEEPVKLRPTPVRPSVDRRFQLWALITRPAYDAYGRATQETFCDLCPVDDGVLVPTTEQQWAADAGGRYRARLVEVQALPGQADALRDGKIDERRDFFFPIETDTYAKEARARIVRVSPPIEHVPTT